MENRMFYKVVFAIFFTFSSFANWEVEISQKKRSNFNLVKNLVANGYYFSAIPLIKEELVAKASLDSNFANLIDIVINQTGVKPFELLDVNLLSRTQAESFKYIRGKRFLKDGKLDQAITVIKSINANHPIYPFAVNLLATAYSIKGDFNSAINSFKDCLAFSSSTKRYSDDLNLKQIQINRDYCLLGIARAYYSAKNYTQAELAYLDLPKNSPVWPEILLEEAWNSYYLGNINRSLGKLVTYRAPIMLDRLIPEVNVLESLSYMRFCLYDDAQKIADKYYNDFMQPVRSLRSFLLKQGKNYNYYYQLMAAFEDKKRNSDDLIGLSLASIAKEPAYQEIRSKLFQVSDEYKKISLLKRTLATRRLLNLAAESLKVQKTILGSYVRTRMLRKYSEFYQAFVDMSYIKLEILAQKKERLYNPPITSEKRGDVRYLDRNDKQYFWEFNGEFWADELGDYVYALKSEC